MATLYPVQTAVTNGETYDEGTVRGKLAALTADPSFNGRKLSGVAAGSAAGDVTIKSQMDTATAGVIAAAATDATTKANAAQAAAIAAAATDATSKAPSTVTVIKTAVYTPALGEIVRVDPTAAGFVVNLPAAGAGNSGQKILVKNVSGSLNVVTLTPSAGQTIDAAATFAMNQAFEAVTLVSDGGTNWMVM